jgi:hypothetical protein
VANYKCGKNQTQAKQLVAAKVWLGKLWLETKQAQSVVVTCTEQITQILYCFPAFYIPCKFVNFVNFPNL